MICRICGANNADNMPFCSECGAPLAGNNQAVQPQQMQQPQPVQQPQQQMQPQQMQQVQQQMQPQQIQQARPVVPQQQMQPQQFVQQPQQMSQQQMEQEWMKQQWLKQQVRQQGTGMQQPQQMTQQMQPQQMQQARPAMPQQPQQMQQARPVAKKKSHAGLIFGIIIALLLAAAAVVFFIFVMPKLSKAAPKGEYINEDFGGKIIFDDGVYAVYDSEGGYEFGTYEVKGGKITFTTVNGDVDYGKYDKKDNTVEYGYLFTLDSADRTFDVDIDKSYVNGLRDKIEEAAKAALAEEEVKTEASEFGSYYYIYGNELADGKTAFSRALSEKLGYGSDKVLSYLMENNFITIEITINADSQTAAVIVY